ncbi:MAG TPA: hypothetical protein PKU80_02645 [Candidatus Limiplasma sp.]|nr:hypothetical protein [Candidatus Limiplasma sp.]HRX08158.1 hypothetical protein [Candidatus Limiplasma sp.]
MGLVYHNFDLFFNKQYEAAYRFAFLLCRHPDAASAVVFQAMLASAASDASSPQEDETILFAALLAECEGYYLKKPHRLQKREKLQKLTPFPISDPLWQALKAPLREKAVISLHDIAHFEPARIARIIHMKEEAVRKLIAAQTLDVSCVQDIAPSQSARAMLDDIHLRFAERSVAFEQKLRRFKRRLDKLVPYIAAAVILLCIAAILYTANLPAS